MMISNIFFDMPIGKTCLLLLKFFEFISSVIRQFKFVVYIFICRNTYRNLQYLENVTLYLLFQFYQVL